LITKKYYISDLVALFFIFTGFTTLTRSTGDQYAWLPPDFNPKTGVLLIQKVEGPQRQQRKIEEFMKEKYPYKYAFITADDISDTAAMYSDKDVYRFVMLNNYATHIMHQDDIRMPRYKKIPVGMFDFFFIDRASKKQYPPSGKGASWASMPLMYMIDEILKK